MDVPALVRRLGAASDGVVSRQALLRAGCTRSALDRARRTGAVVELQSVAVAVPPLPAPARFVVDAGVVCRRYRMEVRAALLVAGPRALVRGRTALALAGTGLLVEPTAAELLVPHTGRRAVRPGVDVRQTTRRPERFRLRGPGSGDVPTCDPLLAVAQIAEERSVLQAVVALDSLLRDERVSDQALAAAVQDGVLSGRLGRRVARLSHPLSGSPLESVARVVLVEAGLGGFEVQMRLRDGLYVRVDLGYRPERLVVELDGDRYHPDGLADRRRDRLTVINGFRVLRFSYGEVVHEPHVLVDDVRAALGR